MFERLVELWASGPRGGKCGSGWVVGDFGVLTCRHVLEHYLDSVDDAEPSPKAETDRVVQIRQANSLAADSWVDVTEWWVPPDSDVALLKITPGPGQVWPQRALGVSPRLVALAEQKFAATAVGFPDAQERPDGQRGVEQPSGAVFPAVGLRDEQGLVPLDVVDATVPGTAALWKGMSGSAVFTEFGEIVGLVVKVHPERQQKRLLFLPAALFAADLDFHLKSAGVGFDTTLQDPDAHMWRACLGPQALTLAGTPTLVREVGGLEAFGVHRTAKRRDSGERGSAQLMYVTRDADEELDAALTAAAGAPGRLLLVVGDSAAGKTRSAAEAVRRNQGMSERRLIRPQISDGLARLLDSGLRLDGALLWLDDLDKYLSAGILESLQRMRAEHPNAACVATMRTSQLHVRQGQLTDPAWLYLTTPEYVQQVQLDAELSSDETARLAGATDDAVLLAAVGEGVGLGEWLVAGPELLKLLKGATPVQSAVAHTVIGWYRTGLQEPLLVDRAKDLWLDLLPERDRARLSQRSLEVQEAVFEGAVSWLCEPILNRELYEQALAVRIADGLRAHDYVVDRVAQDPTRPAISEVLRQEALRVAKNEQAPARYARLFSVGYSAALEQAYTCALAAWDGIVHAARARVSDSDS